MPRFQILACILALMAHAAFSCAARAARPNVVLIITDDQGYGDFGATGNEAIETPHLDALARGGATLTNFYVSPVCSPTRACLMTGRYNYRTRVADTWIGRSMMEPEETTLAEALRAAGYATGIFGKWHLGDCYPMRPIDQGFEEALVLRGGGLAQPSDPPENERRYTDPILIHNGAPTPTQGYCTDVYFDAALRFIEQARRQDRNFFVYLPTNAPHAPLHDVPPAWLAHYQTKRAALAKLAEAATGQPPSEANVDSLTRIAAMISNIDENVGRLMRRLEASQVLDNTIIVFLTDNGPDTIRYVGPFRGKKSDVFEGGIRSPLWLHWPARFRAGTTSDEPAAHIDLMPTLLAACDVQPPVGVRLDGQNLLGLLTGEQELLPERPIVIQTHRGDVPMRYHHFMLRLGKWKLVHPSGFGLERFEGEVRPQLYDVVADPGERTDLAEQHPDVVADLLKRYDAWYDDVSNTRPDNFAPPRIHIGARAERVTTLTRQDWRGSQGWGRNDRGYWQLFAERRGRYEAKVRIEPLNAPCEVQLRLGDVTVSTKLGAGDAEVDFDDITIEAGDLNLSVIVRNESVERGAYQVELAQQ